MIPAGWHDEDTAIICHRHAEDCPSGTLWLQDGGIVVVSLCCELCGHNVVGAPITAEKQTQPGFHVVCRECGASLTPLEFKGHIGRGATSL